MTQTVAVALPPPPPCPPASAPSPSPPTMARATVWVLPTTTCCQHDPNCCPRPRQPNWRGRGQRYTSPSPLLPHALPASAPSPSPPTKARVTVWVLPTTTCCWHDPNRCPRPRQPKWQGRGRWFVSC